MDSDALLTTFERYIDTAPSGRAVVTMRVDLFDVNYGLFYAPLRHIQGELKRPATTTPGEEWIFDAFGNFVKDEFQQQMVPPQWSSPAAERSAESLIELAIRLRDETEQALVYGAGMKRILDGRTGLDFIPDVHAVLCDDHFGRKANAQNVSIEDFRKKISGLGRGCRIVLLGLPFRDQNPLRVRDDADHVTMAEALFLIRLHCSALAVYQVMPSGTDIAVLSDGSLYAPIFGVEEQEAEAYLAKIRKLRTDLNMKGTVSIVDLKRLVSIYDDGNGIFDKCVEDVKTQILKRVRQALDGTFTSQFRILAHGMRANLNSKRYKASTEERINWLQSGERGDSDLPELDQIAETAAFYAAVNLALRWHDVVRQVIPTTIRGTMHPKPGQFALPKLGSCFPWNGVAIIDQQDRRKMNIEVHSLSEAQRRGMVLTAHADQAGNVIYYSRRT